MFWGFSSGDSARAASIWALIFFGLRCIVFIGDVAGQVYHIQAAQLLIEGHNIVELWPLTLLLGLDLRIDDMLFKHGRNILKQKFFDFPF